MSIAIAEVGFDSRIGYLQVCQPGRQALVYDLIERFRPQVDRKVLAFVRSQVFTPRDFVVDSKKGGGVSSASGTGEGARRSCGTRKRAVSYA